MIWVLLMMGGLLQGDSVTVPFPKNFDVTNWDAFYECNTGPECPVTTCNSTTIVIHDTHKPPRVRRYFDAYCDGFELTSFVVWDYWEVPLRPSVQVCNDDVCHPSCRSIHPHCLRWDADGDLDIDLKDWAYWQRECRPPDEPWDTGQVVLSFCRHDGCWTVFFHEVDGVWEAGLVKHPTND